MGNEECHGRVAQRTCDGVVTRLLEGRQVGDDVAVLAVELRL